MFNPNNIVTVLPQRQWKPLEVTMKETGEKRTIKDYRFNPAIHSNAKVVGETKTVEIAKPRETEDFSVISPQERFAFLKSKGWKSLDASERKNYSELKAKLEPKK
jgi:hypothetical protein